MTFKNKLIVATRMKLGRLPSENMQEFRHSLILGNLREELAININRLETQFQLSWLEESEFS